MNRFQVTEATCFCFWEHFRGKVIAFNKTHTAVDLSRRYGIQKLVEAVP